MNETDKQLTESRRVTEIGVKGLFGLYDHHVKLNHQSQVTILHGPNGVGKTVFLEMVRDFRTGFLSRFWSTPFDEFYMNYSSGAKDVVYPPKNNKLRVLIGGDERYVQGDKSGGPRYILKVSADSKVFFVEVNRMMASRRKKSSDQIETVHRVVECSEHLAEQINKVLTNYAQKAQKLDQTFPQRLLKNKQSNSFSSDHLQQAFETLDKQRQRLRQLGLLDDGDQSEDAPFDLSELANLDQAKYGVMELYLGDTQAKLEVLEHFAKKIEVLLSTINTRFRNKWLTIEPGKGLVLQDVRGNTLKLADLSSGEQHLLVVLYELLFKVEKGTLILIDEPELSWHISWQKQFIDNLIEIAGIIECDVLVATHSPYIVEGHTALMTALSADPVIPEQEAA